MLALLLLGHRWLESVSDVHPRRRPDCEQDLHDAGRGGEHKVAAPLGAAASQDVVLLQVSGDVEVFAAVVAALLEVSNSASASMNH